MRSLRRFFVDAEALQHGEDRPEKPTDLRQRRKLMSRLSGRDLHCETRTIAWRRSPAKDELDGAHVEDNLSLVEPLECLRAVDELGELRGVEEDLIEERYLGVVEQRRINPSHEVLQVLIGALESEMG
jgi:hypothetical protein